MWLQLRFGPSHGSNPLVNQPWTDQSLVAAFKQPQTRDQAFSALIDLYKEKLYWHVRKIVISHDDCDDVLQNTFIKVYQALENFREEARLFTWLYRIATNEALTFLQKKKANLYADWDSVENQLSDSLESDPYFDGNALQRKLQQALLTLPEKQRIVFNMKYFDDLTYEDMSEILGTSVGALKASYHHAVKKVERFFNMH